MWTELGHAQLDNGAVGDAIASYLRRCASAIPGPRARVMLPCRPCAMLQLDKLDVSGSKPSSCATPLQPSCLHHYLEVPHTLVAR